MLMHERSFTRAASRLNMTQSALTTSIKTLERAIGLRLFDRTTRVVMPTSYGERFAAVAERTLEDLERSLDDMRAHAAREHGLVVVAATATTISHLLVPALSDLAARYPGIRVRLVEDLTEGAVQAVRNGQVDLALTTLEHAEVDVEAWPILKDRFELVCAPAHPIARTRAMPRWSDFLNHTCVGLSWQSGIRGLLAHHEAGHAAVRDLRYEASSVAGLASMIRHNLGIAAVPGLIASEMSENQIVRRPLSPAIWRTVSLTIRAGRSPTTAASALLSAALQRLKDIRGANIVPLADATALDKRGFSLLQ